MRVSEGSVAGFPRVGMTSPAPMAAPPFSLPPGSEATTRPSTRAPRSKEEWPSTRRTGNSKPAFSVTLCG